MPAGHWALSKASLVTDQIDLAKALNNKGMEQKRPAESGVLPGPQQRSLGAQGRRDGQTRLPTVELTWQEGPGPVHAKWHRPDPTQ